MTIQLATTELHLRQILDLQATNHYSNLSKDIKQSKGFVTLKHDLELLTKMNSNAQHIIALDKDQLIGYALVMLKEHKHLSPLLAPMFDKFKEVTYQGKILDNYSYYIMGQICIADTHKGLGISQELYQKHREIYSDRFDMCLTEVSSSNIPSMKAHLKVGFEIIYTYMDKMDEWNIIGWKWK